MKIAILTAGSRGDTQPYIALGVALQAMGHSVRLATHENFDNRMIEVDVQLQRFACGQRQGHHFDRPVHGGVET